MNTIRADRDAGDCGEVLQTNNTSAAHRQAANLVTVKCRIPALARWPSNWIGQRKLGLVRCPTHRQQQRAAPYRPVARGRHVGGFAHLRATGRPVRGFKGDRTLRT